MTSLIMKKFRNLLGVVVRKLRNIKRHWDKAEQIEKSLRSIRAQARKTDLKEKVIIVTGSTKGIGRAVSNAFAAAGARIIINGRDLKDVEAEVKGIQRDGGTAIGVNADISTADGVQTLITRALDAYGRIDILVNNAGISGPIRKKGWEISLEDWRNVIDVNLSGAYLCSKKVIEWMNANAMYGRIINVSSGAVQSPDRGMTPYYISKVGLEALTKGLALDSGWEGPVVSAIEISAVQSDLTKKYYLWEDFQLLPPPESVIPVFLHAVTAPPQQIHGRILAGWRFDADAEGETFINGPLAVATFPEFPPYVVNGRKVERTDPDLTVLDRHENTNGMPGKVKDLLKQGIEEFDSARYPDEYNSKLRKSLSSGLKLHEDCFTFGNGSVEIVERVLRVFTKQGDEVIASDPTWFMFDYFCSIFGLLSVKIPFVFAGGMFFHNLDDIAKAISVKTRMIYLVNPSNPVGCGISKSAFLDFMDKVPSHIPIIVDEAYIEFTQEPEILRTHEVISHTDQRLFGIRTFSKFFGLAGFRVGYAFASRNNIRFLKSLEPHFVFSEIAEKAAVAAFSDEEYAKLTHKNLRQEKKRITEWLDSMGLEFIPTETHFLLIKCPVPEERIHQAFHERNIYLPKGTIKGKYFVFPVALPEQNDRNLEILRSLL